MLVCSTRSSGGSPKDGLFELVLGDEATPIRVQVVEVPAAGTSHQGCHRPQENASFLHAAPESSGMQASRLSVFKAQRQVSHVSLSIPDNRLT
jgi:hypothetical protein